jgi:hypothetical protein
LAQPAAAEALSALRRQVPQPSVDERVGRFFRDARAYSRLSLEQLARQLGTSPRAIQCLEAGAVGSFPSWTEIHRIVHGYAALAQFDPRPLLEHIYVVMERAGSLAAAGHAQPAAASQRPHRGHSPAPAARSIAAPVQSVAAATAAALALAQSSPVVSRSTAAALTPATMATAAPMPRRSDRSRRRFVRRVGRGIVAICAVVTVLGTAYWACHARPGPVMAVVNLLPAPVARKVRAGMDKVVYLTAPRRGGLRWIDVENPRTRKTDKLPIAAQ